LGIIASKTSGKSMKKRQRLKTTHDYSAGALGRF